MVRDRPFPAGLAFGRVQEHEVHVGGDVELPAAELAHAHHEEPLAAGRLAVQGGLLRVRGAHRRADGDLGERGDGGHHLVEAREPGEVAVDEGEHDAGAQLAKRLAERRGVRLGDGRHGGVELRARECRGAAERQGLREGRARVRDPPREGRKSQGPLEGGRKRIGGVAVNHREGAVGPSRYNSAKPGPRSRRRRAGPPLLEDSIKAISRSIARIAAALAGAALFVFLAAVLALRYVVFPQIDDYRDDISASLSTASGMAVSIGDVDAGWYGLRPTLILTGVRVADRRGKAVLGLERVEATLSWWTLFAGDLRFHDVDLFSPQLSLRRGADGLIYLADKALNARAAGEDGALAAWLLDQPRLAVHDATLAWQDELAGAPELRLRKVEIAIRKEGRRHLAALNATPPAAISGRLDVRADLLFSRKGEQWEASGTLYAEAARADLARLRAHLPVPETLRAAVGSFRAWVDFEPGRVREVTADLNLRGVRAQLAADVLPLDLDSLSGRAFYRLQEGGYAAGTRGLAFRTREGLAAQAADFSLSVGQEAGQPRRGEIRANGVELKIAAALLDYLPVPAEAKAHANRFAPRGRLLDTSLVWTGETLAKASAFRLKSRFEDLGVNAAEGWPGVVGAHRLAGRRRARRQAPARLARGGLRGGPLPRPARRRQAGCPRHVDARPEGHRGARRGRAPRQRRRGSDGGRHLPDAAGVPGEEPGLGRSLGSRRAGPRDGRGELPAQRDRGDARLARAGACSRGT